MCCFISLYFLKGVARTVLLLSMKKNPHTLCIIKWFSLFASAFMAAVMYGFIMTGDMSYSIINVSKIKKIIKD